MYKYLFTFIQFFLLLAFSTEAQVQLLSVHKKSQVLQQNEKYTVHADCYYDVSTGNYAIHYLSPKEFIKKTNRYGEMKIYFPDKNAVTIHQDFYFSSENELLHYFVNNLTEDLGLRKEGFEMTNSRQDEQYLITTWKAPQSLKGIGKVEMAYKNTVPVYAAYFDKNDKIIRKIYYSDYYTGRSFVLPRRVTEISYTSQQDSVIKRTIYSKIRQNDQVKTHYLDFEIPNDASIIKHSIPKK